MTRWEEWGWGVEYLHSRHRRECRLDATLSSSNSNVCSFLQPLPAFDSLEWALDTSHVWHSPTLSSDLSSLFAMTQSKLGCQRLA